MFLTSATITAAKKSVNASVVSENSRKLIEGYFALKPLGPTKVKGVSEPVNVYEVLGLNLGR